MGIDTEMVELVETLHGPARVHSHRIDEPRAAVALGHGAGGGFESPDLIGATEAATKTGGWAARRAAD
jgi:predicted alpha/beta-hydrolase family hydrolase